MGIWVGNNYSIVDENLNIEPVIITQSYTQNMVNDEQVCKSLLKSSQGKKSSQALTLDKSPGVAVCSSKTQSQQLLLIKN